MNKTTSIFDIIGPVIIGPSSSHTAGAVRLGLMAKKIYKQKPKKINIVLYNSFAKTGKGHGTDKGLLAGILGLETDNSDIKNAYKLAKENGLDFHFEYKDDFSRHPNSVDIIFKEPFPLIIQGESTGGGEICISSINGYKTDIKGDYYTLVLIYKDKPGMVYKVSKCIQKENVNIASLYCDRTTKGEEASMCICLDSALSSPVIKELEELEEMYLFRNVEALKK